MSAADPTRIVVALGGNAITRPGEEGTVEQDYANLRQSLRRVVGLVQGGAQVVLTHGSGPQVGNQMIRVELARGRAPDLPLDVVAADIQGGLGYMIERVLRNQLLRRGLTTPVCALLTQVEVDADDPALARPTKFVGPAYDRGEAEQLQVENGWRMHEDAGRGWRRVVPSPQPRRIVERDLIGRLVEWGALVIVGGGGGIPVTRTPEGELVGVEAVIDKDLAAAVLARDVVASDLYILTGVEQVYLDFGLPTQSGLRYLTLAQARGHLAAGQFPPGSMGPKVGAACQFVEAGGKRALITDALTLDAALAGTTGTWITR
ncbi:MAG: carbamate kinase [Thermoanaerobaculia bacterium]